MKYKIKFKKLIALLTTTSLLVSFVIGPTTASIISNDQTTKEYKQIFKDFILPYSYGKITKAHFAQTDRVIINIQDLHCHPQVQKNISNIIETFDKNYGINKIYLEGAYGKINTEWINKSFGNYKMLLEALDKMIETGRLTGAEYYSVKSGKSEIINGLEEKGPYLENIRRFGQIISNQEKIDLILNEIQDSTAKLKNKYYSKRQYKIEELFNDYKKGKIPSQKYYALISKYIDRLGIDLTKYENTLIYVSLLEIQKNLDYKNIKSELQNLIALLKQQLPYNVYRLLLENTSNFKELEKFYSYIIQLDREYNLDIASNFKELNKYFKYIELSKKINPVELVKEDEFLAQEINTRFSQTQAQRDVVFLISFEKYLKDYVTSKITLDDYKYYKNNISRYKKIYNKYVDNRVLSLLDDYIAQADKFYEVNIDRNEYFTKNMFGENDKLGKINNVISSKDDVNKIIDNMSNVKKIDVVITGGFHSQSVTELLEKQGVSYIVITPNVTDGIKLAEETYYALVREQSKIAFQTIAPIVASLSPELQNVLLQSVLNPQEIQQVNALDDNERIKLISDLVAAKILESDDTGNLEEKLQEIVRAIVDEQYKQQITPELLSKIKNLQQLLKDKEQLQKTIDLVQSNTIKQAIKVVSDSFDILYAKLDSFVVEKYYSIQERTKDYIVQAQITTTKPLETNGLNVKKESNQIDEKEQIEDFDIVREEINPLLRRLPYSKDGSIEKELTVLFNKMFKNENNDYFFIFNLFKELNRTNILGHINDTKYIMSDEMIFILKIFMNPTFGECLEKQYRIKGKELTILARYRVAMKSARRLYSLFGDNIYNLSQNQISTISQRLVDYNLEYMSQLSNTRIFDKNMLISSIRNYYEYESREQRFSQKGIRLILQYLKLDYILKDKERCLEYSFPNYSLVGKEKLLEAKNNWLDSFARFQTYKEEYNKKYAGTDKQIDFGLFIFDGHGSENYLYIMGADGQEDSDLNKCISVEELSQALFRAYQNGVNLEEIVLDLSCCNSYVFSRKVVSRLKQLETENGLEEKYPQIITEAGKETKLGYSLDDFSVGNMYYAIIEYLKNKKLTSFSMEDLFDTEIVGSNHTIHVTNSQIEELNNQFRKDILEVLGSSEYDIEDNSNLLSNRISELQVKSTVERLTKIGNWKIIKKLYKERSGENFRYTSLGLAIGVILETFSLWNLNFINQHDNPTMSQKIVVWVIRALTIGVGFAVAINPISQIAIIPSMLLTEFSIHFIWNISQILIGNKNHLLQQNITIGIESENGVFLSDDIGINVEKENGDKYFIAIKKVGYYQDGKPIKYTAMFIENRQENGKIFDTVHLQRDTKLETTQSIQDLLDIKIQIKIGNEWQDITDEQSLLKASYIRVVSNNTSKVSYVKLSSPIRENFIESGKNNDISANDENLQKLKDRFNIGSITPIYMEDYPLTRRGIFGYEERQKLSYALRDFSEGKTSIAIYPSRVQFDTTKTSLDQQYYIYDYIARLFLEFSSTVADFISISKKFNFELYSKTIAYFINENLKNSFYHGNKCDMTLPIIICFDKQTNQIKFFNVIDKKQVPFMAVSSGLSGYHKGIKYMQGQLSKENKEELDSRKIDTSLLDYKINLEEGFAESECTILDEVRIAEKRKNIEANIVQNTSNLQSNNKVDIVNYELTIEEIEKILDEYAVSKHFIKGYRPTLELARTFYRIVSEMGVNRERFFSIVLPLAKELLSRKIYDVSTEKNFLTFKIFLSNVFQESIKQKKLSNISNYEDAMKIGRLLYYMIGDKVDTLSEEQIEQVLPLLIEKYSSIKEELGPTKLVTAKTGFYALLGSESSFTKDGWESIFKLLDLNLEQKQYIKCKHEYNDEAKIKDWLNCIINYPENKVKYGLENLYMLYSGHGQPTYLDSGKYIIKVEDIVDALLKAEQKGSDLSEITLDLAACWSYFSSIDLIEQLKSKGAKTFPNIVTDAGFESLKGKVGNIATLTETESTIITKKDLVGNKLDVSLSNKEIALIEYILKNKIKGDLSLIDFHNAERTLADHTVFAATNTEIQNSFEELRQQVIKILNISKDEIKYGVKDTFRVEEDFYGDHEWNVYIKEWQAKLFPILYMELQVESTVERLTKIGNWKIIKKLYKERSGENFRYTSLGLAIGVILETFSLWNPNFVEQHNFDPSIESGMRAVVWKIRALSIGLGVIPVLLSLVNPVSAVFVVPTIIITEWISHFVWNIKNINYTDNLLQKSKQKLKIKYDKEDYVIVALIRSEDGTQYSIRILPNKNLIYLSSIDSDAYSSKTSQYTTIEDIEKLTGVRISIDKNKVSLETNNPNIDITYVKNSDISKIVSKLESLKINVEDTGSLRDRFGCEEVEYVYLDDDYEINKKKIELLNDSEEKLIVLYPFSKAFDIDSLTDEQLYSLYFDISSKFFDMSDTLFNKFPQLKEGSFVGMEYVLKEFVKNAFVHGNLSDPSKPIYIKYSKNGFTVYNEINDGSDISSKNKKRRLDFSASATLTGAHRGLEIIDGFEKEGLLNITTQTQRIKTIGTKQYYAIEAIRKEQKKIKLSSLIERIYEIRDIVETTNNKYKKELVKGQKEAEAILADKFSPEELEIVDLLASVIFDSIKYVNCPHNTSSVEFVNIIYALQNGLFNDNLLPKDGKDLKQHILDMLEHYVQVSKQKKGEDNILVMTLSSNPNLMNELANFIVTIVTENNGVERKKQEIVKRKQNIEKFINGVQNDDEEFSAIMICSANENRSAIWHIMFEDFLKRTNRTRTRVFSAGVFYDISEEDVKKTGKPRSLRQDYSDTLEIDERYKGVDKDIKTKFRSTYIKFLRLPKNSQQVYIVAGEQHRAQLIKLGYDPSWIFLMSEFYSDEFKEQFKKEHPVLGKQLEDTNIFSMSEFPDPYEEQISRQDLPELVTSLINYDFENSHMQSEIPAQFIQFADDYNQFENMDNLPSFAFTDTEKREAMREFYEDDISGLARENYKFKFVGNTKYLYILQNKANKELLLNIISQDNVDLKFKLFAMMYLSKLQRELSAQEIDVIDNCKTKIIKEFEKQLENNEFAVLNNLDLRSYMMGVYLMLSNYSTVTRVPDIVFNAFIINKDGSTLANSDGFFAEADLFTIIHELTHIIVSKPKFFNRLASDTIDELVSYITPNLFLSIVKLSSQAYYNLQGGYNMHQSNGIIDYVKMGKKFHALYNLFNDKTDDYDLEQEEHSAPIAYLDLLFNAHKKIGKVVDWEILLDSISGIYSQNTEQSIMFWTILKNYTDNLVKDNKFTQQEAENLKQEFEKMQLWTMLSYDMFENIKQTSPETVRSIIGNQSEIVYMEKLLSNPTKTKEFFVDMARALKNRDQLSRTDLLNLLIMDLVTNVEYEQLAYNFENVVNSIILSIKNAMQLFDMQQEIYSLQDYKQISEYVVDNFDLVSNTTVDTSVMDNIVDFISGSLEKMFFVNTLINKVFGVRNLSTVLQSKKLLITKTKQQEEQLQQVLKDNNVENIAVVTLEIIIQPTTNIRSEFVIDVENGIRAKYDGKENKIIVYSKQGITMSEDEIQDLIMKSYFAERNQDIISEDVIAFAKSTDITLNDITNRLNNVYTDSVVMPNKDTKFDLSKRPISDITTVCKQEFVSTGIKTFVVSLDQATKFANEIAQLQEQDFKFVVLCNDSKSIVDANLYNGLMVNATDVTTIEQAMKLLETIKKNVSKQGLAKQVSIKFSDAVYQQLDNAKINIFDQYGIVPVIDATTQNMNLKNIGKTEVVNITEDNVEQILRNNNVFSLIIDNARILVGKKEIIKEINTKEQKYNKGYNASLNSKFNYTCADVTKLAQYLIIDITDSQNLEQILKSIDLSQLGLSIDSQAYLQYLLDKQKYEEMLGFIRGITMNSARKQMFDKLIENGATIDIEKFKKVADGKYQKSFLTLAVQLMLEGQDITDLLETGFIDSNMTMTQYLEIINEKVNISIDDILKQNEYKITKLSDVAKAIENFKNFVEMLDNLKVVKEQSVKLDMSINAVKHMLAAA